METLGLFLEVDEGGLMVVLLIHSSDDLVFQLLQLGALLMERLLSKFILAHKLGINASFMLEFLILIILLLHELLILSVKLLQEGLFLQLLGLLSLQLSLFDLLLEQLYLVELLLLFLLTTLCFLSLIIDRLLDLLDLLDFLLGQSDGTPHILRVLPDLIDFLLALVESAPFLVVRGLEYLELLLVLFTEFSEVGITNDFINELPEVTLDVFKLVLAETQLLHPLQLLILSIDSFDIELGLVFVGHPCSLFKFEI